MLVRAEPAEPARLLAQEQELQGRSWPCACPAQASPVRCTSTRLGLRLFFSRKAAVQVDSSSCAAGRQWRVDQHSRQRSQGPADATSKL